MERINEDDIDCFLLQMEQVFAPLPEREKRQEDWRHFSSFTMWIPTAFRLADRETDRKYTGWNTRALRRMAGRRHQFLVPDSRMKGVRIYYSTPQEEPFDTPAGGRYTMRKGSIS